MAGEAYAANTALLGLVTVLLLAILLPPLDALLEGHEALHHFQHGLTLVLGITTGVATHGLVATAAVRATGRAQAFARDLLVTNRRFNPGGFVSLALAAGLVVVWHIPFLFNLAFMDDTVHILEHLSFVVAGAAGGFGLHTMSQWTRLGAVLVATLGTLFLSVVLVVFQPNVYTVYPPEQEIIFGVAMIYAMMPLMLIVVYRFLVAQVS